MENFVELNLKELNEVNGGGPLTIMNGFKPPIVSFFEDLWDGLYDGVSATL